MFPALLPTYNRTDVAFVRGEGSYLFAEDGKRYLDFGAGIAVNAFGHANPKLVGALTVQALALTPDDSKLLVVHTARQIAGQDRYGIGVISTTTNQLLPWRTRLWDDYLPFVGGITRIYAGAIAPNGQWFVVSSGSGGDRPPISDTAIRFNFNGNGSDNEQRDLQRRARVRPPQEGSEEGPPKDVRWRGARHTEAVTPCSQLHVHR